jgi:protein-disulfide isomerase-like protein with CxxC motif
MDENVYPNDTVAQFMNARFLAVKCQMDTSKQDNEEVRQGYATAREIAKQYHIREYPTFLFFAPDGHIVHRAKGSKNVNAFITLAKTAIDPQQQFYTLISEYEHADRNYAAMLQWITIAERLGEDSIAEAFAEEYIHYLESLEKGQLWTKENLTVINAIKNFVSSKDKLFRLYFQDKGTIDSVMHAPGYSDGLINNIIYKDEITSQLDEASEKKVEPAWHNIQKGIKKKYGNTYVKNVLIGRVNYYQTNAEWGKYVKYLVLQTEARIPSLTPGVGSEWYLSDNAYEVFKYSDDKKKLEKALSWVERGLAMITGPDPSAMDTKANLLYKLGRKEEGLTLEEQSANLAPEDKEIQGNFEKMKGGLATWYQH